MNLRGRFNELSTGMKAIVAVAAVGAAGVALVAAVLGTAVVGTFALSSGDSVSAGPSASFSFAQADGTVDISLADGEPLPADSVVVSVDGDASTWAERASDGLGLIEQGDSLSVDAESGATIEVQWTGGSGEPIILGTYTVM